MPVQLIEGIYDLPAIQAQHEQVISFLKEMKGSIITTNDIRINLKGVDLATFIKATEDLNKTIAKSNTAAQAASKAYNQLTLEQAKLSEATKAANADTRLQAKILNEAERAAAAGGETVAQLKLKLDQLTKNRDRNITILNPEYLAKANTEIHHIKTTIDKIEQSGGNFRGNVGNYTKSIEILKQSLQEATVKLTQMTEAGTLQTEQGQKMQTEVSLLNELVGQQSQGFSSLSRELMNTGKALETLHENGLKNTEAFHLLEKEFTDAKLKLKEFRVEQNLLTTEAPKIAALTTVTKGLAGIYAAGAGAAALFAGDNEHLQKELNKLVAVMTILQGLNEINDLLLKKNAVSQILFGGATAATSVALEEEAVAATAAGEATGFFGKALLFIEANPLLLTLTALAGVLIYLVSTFKSEEDQLKETAKASKDYSDAKGKQIDIINEENKLLNTNIDLQKKRAQSLLSEAEARGADPATIFAYKKAINDLDKRSIEEQLKSHPKVVEDINNQSSALESLLKKQKEEADIVSDLAEKKSRGLKTTTRASTFEEKNFFGTDTREVGIDREIERHQNLLKINDEAVFSAKSTLDKLHQIKDAGEEQDHKDAELQNEQAKFSADERRKLALATAQIEVDTIKDKNGLILANEHSTLEQRLAAMKSNAEAEKKLAKAEKSDVLNDPTQSANDKIIAEKEYKARILQITRDTNAELLKEQEVYDRRSITATTETVKSNLEVEIKASDEVAKNATLGLDVRAAAYAVYYKDQQELILKDADLQKKTKVLTDEELIALDTQTKNKLLELARQSKKDISEIYVSSLKETLAATENNDNLELARAEAKNDVFIGNKKKRDEANAELEFQSKRKQLNDAIDVDVQVLQSSQSTDQQRVDAKHDANDKLAALYKLDTDHFISEEDKKKKAALKTIDAIKQAGDDVMGVIGGIINDQTIATKNRLQDESDAAETKSSREIDAINASAASEEEKANRIAIVNARLAAQKEQIAQKERKADLEKARFEKAAAIFDIILSTAQAVAKALATLNVPLAIALGALGAAQLSVVLAQPLPKYKGGRGYGKEELALVHPGEFIHRQSGGIEGTPGVESLTHLMPKDKVYPSKAAMMKDLALSALPVSNYQLNRDGGIGKADMKTFTNEIVEAVGSIQFHGTILKDGELRRFSEKMRNYDNWVNRVIKN